MKKGVNVDLMLVIMSGLVFVAGTLLASWFLQRGEAARRRLKLIARMGGAAFAPQNKRGLAALLARLPLVAKVEQKQRWRQTHAAYSLELPRMLEIVALGVRSGLGFDQALALYVRRFDTPLAELCRSRFEIWERGLMPREQGLKELAKEVGLPMFDRFVSTTLRALNYGAALNNLLLDLATEARKAYRSQQQELVAKAPVKMLLPTGALILPAMLLLVIGPILLELTGKMV